MTSTSDTTSEASAATTSRRLSPRVGEQIGDIWQTADAGDHKLRTLLDSSRRGRPTLELGAEDKQNLDIAKTEQ